jgi:hypothetical protein
MSWGQPFPAGGRRVDRPEPGQRCPGCCGLVGRGYPECPGCTAALDGVWLADWAGLCVASSRPEVELAEQVLAASVGEYPWTCLDWAMSLVDCPACGQSLSTGPVGCVLCRIAEETRWEWEQDAPRGAISRNEHGLRAARAALRAPHRHRATVVQNWRLAVPFLLTGEAADPSAGPWVWALLRAGRYEELASCASYRQFARPRELPWS